MSANEIRCILELQQLLLYSDRQPRRSWYSRLFRRYTGVKRYVICEDPDQLGYWWEKR